jgi:hypothetical protein
MCDVKIRGREVYADGELVAEIHGYRDPSGRNHLGYHIRVPGHGTIGLWLARHGEPKSGYVSSHHGCYTYAQNAHRQARLLFQDDGWKDQLDYVIKAALDAQEAEGADLPANDEAGQGDEPDALGPRF